MKTGIIRRAISFIYDRRCKRKCITPTSKPPQESDTDDFIEVLYELAGIPIPDQLKETGASDFGGTTQQGVSLPIWGGTGVFILSDDLVRTITDLLVTLKRVGRNSGDIESLTSKLKLYSDPITGDTGYLLRDILDLILDGKVGN